MIVKVLTEHHLEFLRLKGGCRGSSESTLLKMSNCWKSHALAKLIFYHSDNAVTYYYSKYFFECIFVNIFLSICFNICFGCSNGPSH